MTTHAFMEDENALRKPEYSKDPSEEHFIERLGTDLQGLEKYLRVSSQPARPNVFVFGLPRAGTTLVYQVLANSLHVAWPTNLMARFWRVPVVGTRLSRMLGLFNEEVRLESRHGVTAGAAGPHEFGYFWMHWLGYNNVIQKPAEHESTIDWQGLKSALDAVSGEAQCPVIYKNTLFALHLPALQKMQPDAVFIYCKRNLRDAAVSILCTRKERYGTENEWWSLRPPHYEKLLTKLPDLQVAHQVCWFSQVFSEVFSQLPETNRFAIQIENSNTELPRLLGAIRQKLGIAPKPWNMPEIRIPHYKNTDQGRAFERIIATVREDYPGLR